MMINEIVTGVAEETIQRVKYHVGVVLRIVQNVQTTQEFLNALGVTEMSNVIHVKTH